MPTVQVTALGHPEVTGSNPVAVIKPDMDALRMICAGKVIPDPTRLNDPVKVFVGADLVIKMCQYTEWHEGEQWQCGLAEHPAKVKHTRGRVV